MLSSFRTHLWLVLTPALAGLILTCEEGKDIDLKTRIIKDGAEFTIPAKSHVAYAFSVTDDMKTVPEYEDCIRLYVNCRTKRGEVVDFLLLTEDNYLAYEQGLPYTVIEHKNWDRFQYEPAVSALGNYYVVFANPDSVPIVIMEYGNPSVMVAITWWVFI